MSLILKLDLDMVNIYLHTKIKFLAKVVQESQPEQTDPTEIITFLHTRMVTTERCRNPLKDLSEMLIAKN